MEFFCLKEMFVQQKLCSLSGPSRTNFNTLKYKYLLSLIGSHTYTQPQIRISLFSTNETSVGELFGL